jgi:hypothetical protein
VLVKNNIYENDPHSRVLIIKLLENPEFRDMFLRRIAWCLKTVWNAECVVARIDEIHDMIAPDMHKEASRWSPSVATWEQKVQKLRDFALNRNDYFVKHIQNFFGLTDQQMREYGFEV